LPFFHFHKKWERQRKRKRERETEKVRERLFKVHEDDLEQTMVSEQVKVMTDPTLLILS